MEKWLTLHNRVKLMLQGIGVAVVGQALLVFQGAEDIKTAALLTGAAVCTAVLGYLAPSEGA